MAQEQNEEFTQSELAQMEVEYLEDEMDFRQDGVKEILLEQCNGERSDLFPARDNIPKTREILIIPLFKTKKTTHIKIPKPPKKRRTANKGIQKRRKPKAKGKPVVCEICNKTFKTNSNLAGHMRGHNGNQFQCDYCPFKSGYKSVVATHTMRHTGERPHPCNLCSYAARTRKTLLEHLERHHNVTDGKKRIKVKRRRAKPMKAREVHSKIKEELEATVEYLDDEIDFKEEGVKDLLFVQCKEEQHLDLTMHDNTPDTEDVFIDLTETNTSPQETEALEKDSIGNGAVTLDMDVEEVTPRSHAISVTHKTQKKTYININKQTKKTKLSNKQTQPKKKRYIGIKKRPCRKAKGKVKSFICDFCGAKFNYRYGIIGHLRVHYGTEFTCQYCPYKVGCRSSMRTHTMKHTGERPYPCELCAYKARTTTHLRRHLKTHYKPYKRLTRKVNRTRIFQCDICSKTYNFRTNMIQHLKSHNAPIYSCEFCPHKTLVKNNLDVHMKKHTGEKGYECDYCGYENVFKVGMVKHMKANHTLSCDECKYKCFSKSDLEKHVLIHTGGVPYACEHCPYKTHYKGSYSAHVNAHFGVKQYACEQCSYSCSSKITFDIHMRKHSGADPYKCDLCSYETYNKQLIRSHMKVHCSNIYKCEQCPFTTRVKWSLGKHVSAKHIGHKPFTCCLCGHKTTTSANLRSHEKREHKFPCEQCNFIGSTKKGLLRHLKAHREQELYTCELCLYQCYGETNFKTHMKLHCNEKLYSCQLCDYTTFLQVPMDAHTRSHTGEKPFLCSQCAFKTASLIALISHRKIHDVAKQYLCEHCSYECRTKSSLRSHIKRRHTNVLPCDRCFKPKRKQKLKVTKIITEEQGQDTISQSTNNVINST